MLKPFSRTLLALALLSPLTVQAQQDDAARQKELEAARTDLRRAAHRGAELSRGADTLRAPIRIDRVVAGRPRLGVLLAGDDEGVRIAGVTPDSGAARAGLKAGDIIIEFDGKKINSPEELIVSVRSKNVGDRVTLVFMRDGAKKSVTLNLIAAKK